MAPLRFPALLLATILTAAAADGPPGATPVVVIVHAGAMAADLTRERVVDLLTGRVATLPDGGRAVLVLSHGDGGEAAVRALAARDVDRLVRGWKRMVFGGGGSMPLTADDDRAALDLLVRTPGGLLPMTGVEPKDLPAGLQAVTLR